jgi:hypothetical protein
MLPVIVKTAPSVSAKSNASGLTDSELRVCKMLGLTPEQFAAEKALRANANTSEEG